MTRTVRLLALLLFLLAAACARPVPNLWETHEAIYAYHDSGRFEADTARTASDAQAYMARRLAQGVQRPALVLDVDDTALSTFAFARSRGFWYQKDAYEAHEAEASLPAIGPVRDLANWAAQQGVAVFFVTGRPQALCPATRLNLERQGYARIDAVVCRPPRKEGEPRLPAAVWKPEARAAIAAQGHAILVTMGDQESDITGGHAERGYKLPNHVYRVP